MYLYIFLKILMNSELRIASIGNVDSAKSTTISCLAYDILDNGKGEARKKIFQHKHELNTGRTSAISQNIIIKKNKIFNFIDLAGHEKYLKTTMSGLSGYFIDYAMVTIGGDRGIIGMTKEHMGIALALDIPIFIVITKIDVSPKDKLENIINNTIKLISSKAAGSKIPKIINHNDNISILDNWYNKNICPVFLISNINGYNLENLKNFIYKLNSNLQTNNLKSLEISNTKFIIDDIFKIKGVGIVLSGYVKSGELLIGDQLYLGPFQGRFKLVTIKSIHDNFKNTIEKLSCNISGCISIKLVNSKKDSLIKNEIKKGMVLLKNPECKKIFHADILLLKHPTTITKKYQPVIHCGSIRQTAKINFMNKELIRTGDKASVIFEFLFHPEFLEIGSKLLFRDGLTKGTGIITHF